MILPSKFTHMHNSFKLLKRELIDVLYKQAEAEVVPSSSLVEVVVEVDIEVGVAI